MQNTTPISRESLVRLYQKERKSMQEIAEILGCSHTKVGFWMRQYKIPRRTISDAVYVRKNPSGDPFKYRAPVSSREYELFGMGLGLFMGEGNKACADCIRLGNTDPVILNYFIAFLVTFFGVRKSDMKFGLQIFTDINPRAALAFWTKMLTVDKSQFQKPVITISGSIGTYRKKSANGVVTVYYYNTRLRRLLGSMLPK